MKSEYRRKAGLPDIKVMGLFYYVSEYTTRNRRKNKVHWNKMTSVNV
jgi:hypothetical protein